MAWALQFDGVNDYVPTPVQMFALSTDEWSFKFSLVANGSQSGSFYRFMSKGFGDNSSRIIFRTNGTEFRYNDGASVELVITGLSYAINDDFELRNTLDNGFQLLINNSIVYTDATRMACDLGVFGENFGSYGNFGLVSAEFINSTAPANNVSYDATASSHAAGTPILTDTIGGNDATGVNMPTDGSAWVDLGGGGVTVTGATPSFNYSSIAAGIDLTGSIDVTGQTANYTYSAVNGFLDLTGDILVTGATASYNYQSINSVVDLTGEITVLGATPNQSYSSVNGIIELGAVISVVGLTPNYNYKGIAGEVSLNGEILVSGETPSYSYSAIKGFVTTGEAQVIGTVTSSFASDVYSSGFKPSTITVNFKS